MRWIRLALRVVLIVLIVVASTVVIALVALQTPAGRQRVGELAASQLQNSLRDADVSVDGVGGNLLRSPTLRGLTISRDGEPVVTAERIDVRYDAIGLLRGQLTIDELIVRHPVIHVERGPRGLTIVDLFPGQEEGTPRMTARQFEVAKLEVIDGRIVVGSEVENVEAVNVPNEFVDLDALLSLARTASGMEIDVARLSTRATQPPLIVEEFRGGIRHGPEGWRFEDVVFRTSESVMRLQGAFRNTSPNTGGAE